MAGSFLGRWFARPPAKSEELEQALRELDRHIAERPAFRHPLEVLRNLLPILAEPADALAVTIDPELAQTKLASGVPLLRGERRGVSPTWLSPQTRRAYAATLA